ncbi:MAG TPA: tRNA pseudouridine(38-40) synthase TruA [Vicinamibacterales bacterium]|nr:tRNA pseudouridine(38-40) synthase TruA [Vicinamibacterales bacterium]
MRTLKFVVQYDGTGLVGWQRQAAGISVQGLLEDALSKIEGAPVAMHGAGRTDAGVHALAQVAHARVSVAHDPETMVRAMNANLPEFVRIVDVSVAADDFHARFSARSKTYEYRVWNAAVVPPFLRLYVWHVPQPLEIAAMNAAAAALVGEHDFAAFQGVGTPVHSTVRRITTARWRDQTRDEPLTFEVSGEGFLRHMVRALVGTMVEIGRGARAVDDIPRLLASRNRHAAGRTAPANGLFLAHVEY